VPTTFFCQQVEGIGYVRCGLPARALADGSQVIELDEWIAPFQGKTPEECWAPFETPAVWQLASNWYRLHAMRDYRRITGQPVLFEVDDNYVGNVRGYERNATTLDKTVNDGTPQWVLTDVPEVGYPWVSSPHIQRRVAEEADGVIVSTPFLKEVYGEYNDNVHVCRNLVDPTDWPALAEPDGTFRIVFAASPNMQDLALIRQAMEWAAQQPGVECWVIGYKPHWRGVREHAWFESVPEYRAFMAALRPDVWLRPIEKTQFSRGKSDLKILESAMVSALPIVTGYDPYLGWRDTPVRFAHDPKSWQQEVRWCIKNQDAVRAGAQEIRETVLATRGLEAGRADWSAALSSVH
jgi:hypothetical protein